ncbi:DegT/DnrJ/EryC1/StrS family aminotransferase [bacterium BMS3Abin03]|jgi:perosamine synthetase|nr:DegT/DnrJ/EryC1/StrS family aminotransferase [bacterium BMS3Abin03]MCG6960964.1 DegT/DnrJ/EryC1/StrS family aminotransferase [bacterium BMS3Abin03]
MKYKYPVYQPNLSGNEKNYVNECLDSTWISSKGKFIKNFEDNFSRLVNIKYSAGVSNGTVALHVALLALGVGKEDEVIVPTFTYIASVNAITYAGAKPVFVDSDPVTWQIDPKKIKEKITGKTKAVMAVHLYGHPCDMDSIKKIAIKNNLYVIEDCAEAIGTNYNSKHVGSFGDVATFSFFGNKAITTGEGGMVCTNNLETYNMAIRIKGQGLARDQEYFHDIIGYNYRMTNICAAIGCAQLERIEDILERKRKLAKNYINGIKVLGIDYHKETGNVKHSYWMFTILVNSEKERTKLRNFLAENGIETRPTFHPVHTMPMYFEKESYPVAEDLGKRGINLPSYPDLTDEDVDYIIGKIKSFYNVS